MAERKIQRGKTSYWAYAMNWTILTLHAVRLQVAQWLKRRENRLKLKKEVTEQHKARASQVRARGHWVKKGEKNTKYFTDLENSTANVKIIGSLINKAAQLVTDQKDMKMQRDHYAKSYRRNISNVNKTDCLETEQCYWRNNEDSSWIYIYI